MKAVLLAALCFGLCSCATDGVDEPGTGFVTFIDRLDEQKQRERLARASAPQYNYYGGGNSSAAFDYLNRSQANTQATYYNGLNNFQRQASQRRIEDRLDDIESAVRYNNYIR